MCAVALAGTVGTFAAFTARTTNAANNISSGTVKIDQHPGSTSLYNASGKKPGEDTTGCVRVTYSGSLPAMVRLYQSSGAISSGAAYNLKVERGTGLASPGASMSCTGFNASSTVYNAALSGFAGSFDGGNPAKTGGTAWAQNDTVDYRFTITPNDDTGPNNHTAEQSTSPHDFTWEARNYSGYPAEVLATPGLQSYWRLGESSGTAAYDTSPTGGITGTYTNGPALGRPSLTSDTNDSAVGLDGIDDFIGFGDNYDFAGVSTGSAELWFTPTSINESNYRHILDKRTSDGAGLQGWLLDISPSSGGVPGKFNFERWKDGANANVGSGAVVATPGVRRHLAITFDGSKSRMYVDGVLLGTSSATGFALPDTAVGFRIGSNTSGNRPGGDVDDLATYNRALSAAEIKAHYDAGK